MRLPNNSPKDAIGANPLTNQFPSGDLDGPVREIAATSNAANPAATNDIVASMLQKTGASPQATKLATLTRGRRHSKKASRLASTEPVKALKVSTAADYAARVNRHLGDCVWSVVEAGRILLEAKHSLRHGKWETLFETRLLHIDLRTAQKMMRIAQHGALSNPTNSSLLPMAVDSLNTLSRLEVAQLQNAIDTGCVTPNLTAKEARKLVSSLKSGKVSPASANPIASEAAAAPQASDSSPAANPLPVALTNYFAEVSERTQKVLINFPEHGDLIEQHLEEVLQEIRALRATLLAPRKSPIPCESLDVKTSGTAGAEPGDNKETNNN